jgi:hypothetical protein
MDPSWNQNLSDLDGEGSTDLKVTIASLANNGETLVLEWLGQVDRSYLVEYSPVLEPDQWLPLKTIDSIEQPLQTVTLTGLPSDQPHGFFRIRLIHNP